MGTKWEENFDCALLGVFNFPGSTALDDVIKVFEQIKEGWHIWQLFKGGGWKRPLSTRRCTTTSEVRNQSLKVYFSDPEGMSEHMHDIQ